MFPTRSFRRAGHVVAMRLIVVGSVLLAAMAAQGQGSLNLSANVAHLGTNGSAGVCFDIVTGSTPVIIYRLGNPASSAASHTQAIWYRPGGMSSVYPTTSSSFLTGWTSAGTFTHTFAAADVIEQLPLTLSIQIPANSRYGFAICGAGVRYYHTGTSLPPAPNSVSDANITIDYTGWGGGTAAAGPAATNWSRAFGGTVWYDIAQINGTHAEVNTVRLTGDAMAAVGNNAVEAVVRNIGTNALDNQSFTLEFSGDGVNWISEQFSFPTFPALSNQTCVFPVATKPWVISGAAAHTLQVRLTAPIGQGTALKSRTYAPDADIELISINPFAPPPLNAPINVSVLVRNNGSFNLNGVTLNGQYSINGVNYFPDTFTPTTLATNGATQTFQFQTPLVVTTAGSYTLTCALFPGVLGDPDAVDFLTYPLDEVGIPVARFGTGTTTGTATGPLYRPAGATANGSHSVHQALYLASDLPALPSGVRIENISFFKTNAAATVPPFTHTLRVWLRNTTETVYAAASNYGTVTTAGTLVYENTAWTLPANTGWMTIGPFDPLNSFIYTGGNLEVTVEFNCFGQYASTTDSPAFQYNAITSDSRGRGQNILVSPVLSTQSIALNGISSGVRRHHIRIEYSPPSTADLDVATARFGAVTTTPGPQVGSNVVNAVIRSLGSQPFTGSIDVGYSTNGGQNWVMQNFATAGLSSQGSIQTVQFTQPWVISAAGPTELRFRIFPQVQNDPDPTDEVVFNYVPDVDLVTASMSQVTTLGSPATISALVANDGSFSLNGLGIPLQYSINDGPFSAPETFTPSSLGAAGSTESFNFTQQYTPPLQGVYSVTVRVATPVAGDPDATDEAAGQDLYVGYAINTYGTGSTMTITAPPIARASDTSTSDNSMYQMLYTAADLGNIPAGSVIRGLSFNKGNDGASNGNDVLRVWLNNLPSTTLTYTGAATYAVVTAAPAVLVYDTSTFRVPRDTGWLQFGVFNDATPFVYTGGNLEVIVEYNCIATPTPTTNAFGWIHNVITSDSRGRGYNSATAITTTTSLTLNGTNSGTRRPHLRVHYQPGNVPAITTPVMLGSGEEGVAYNAQVNAVGGAGGPNYTWAVASGTIPPGLSINPATGAITGSPAALSASSTPYIFGISATDASGTGTRNFSITILPLQLNTPSGTLDDGIVGTPYLFSVVAAGGGVSKSYAVTSGALPPGLTLNPSSGVISGVPTVASIAITAHRFTITVTSGTATASADFTLMIHPPEITFGTGTTNGEGGPPVNRTATAVNDYSAYVMMYTPANLPGLAAGSIVTGIAFYKETASASTGDDILRVWLRNTTSHTYRGGVVINQWTHGATLVADHSNYRFPAAIGWLDFGPFNTGNAFVYEGANLEVLVEYNSYHVPGNPSTGGYFWRYDAISPADGRGMGYAPNADFLPLPETSSLGVNGNNSGLRRPHLRVNAFLPTIPVIGGGQPAPADEGVFYSHALAAVGGNGGTYTWAITAGALPTGLALNPASGQISGTPAAGTRTNSPYRFTVSATDASGTGIRTLELEVRSFAIATPAGPMLDPIAGSPYSQTVVAVGGASPRIWSITAGTLPVGLSLSASTGVISGTPALSNVTGVPFTFTLTVTDGTSATLSREFSLNVLGPFFEYGQLSTVAPNTGITIPPMIRNSATNTTDVSLYQVLFDRTDLAGFQAGSVIQGLSFRKDGVGQSVGDDILRIWLRNTDEAVYFGSKTYADWVNGAMLMMDSSTFRMPPIDGWVQFGPFNSGNTFIYTGGNLEVSIEYNALASAIPATDLFGWHSNVLPVHNRGRGFGSTAAPLATSIVALNGQNSGIRRPHMRIHHFAPLTPKIASDPLPPGDEGVPYTAALLASGGNGGPWTWAITNGTLPTGLTLNTGTGVISGTPAVGSLSVVPYAFTVTATDAAGVGALATSITIRQLATKFSVLTLPPAGAGIAYSAAIEIVGGTVGPRTFTVFSGALPPGLTLNAATGVISGSPLLTAVSATPYTFTIQVTDGTGVSGSLITMLVNDAVIEYGTGTTGAVTTPPIIRASAATTVDVSVTQFLYYASDLPSLPAGALLNSIAFNKVNDGASVAGAEHTLQIWLRNTTENQYFTSPAFQDLIAGATLVYDDALFAMPATIGWITIPFNTANPFIYTGGNLEVIVHFDCTSTVGDPTTNSFNWRYDLVPGTIADYRGRGITASVPISPVTLVTLNGQNASVRRPHVQFGVGAAAQTDLDLGRVTFGASQVSIPVIGSNTVHVEVRNTGSTPYSGPFTLEYSINGGSNWVTQPFSMTQATGIGYAETYTFTTPWVLATTGAAIQVRINPILTGDPDTADLLDLSYPADLDVEAINLQAGANPVFGNNTLVVTVANRGQLVLSGQNFALQFSTNNGASWSNAETFSATNVASPGQSAQFTLAAPWNVTTVSNTTVLVRFAPQLAGDPDTTDEFGRIFLATGGAFEVLGNAFEFPSIVGLPAAGSNGYPFNTVWEDQRLEAIYLASELTAAGLYAGALITGMQLKCAQLPGMEIQNFRVRVQHTSLSQHNVVAYTTTGFTSCFGPTTIPLSEFTIGEWVRFPFHTSFVWDGVSNLKVDFSTDGAAFVSGGGCFLRETPGAWRSIVGYEDSAVSFPFESGMLQLFPKTNVPALRVEFPIASNPGILVSRTGIIPDGNVDELFDTLTATLQSTLTYTILNYGTSSTLNISAVNITGATNCVAVVSTSPVSTPIAPGLTGSMAIQVTPSAGAYSFNVEVVSNASAVINQSYTFTVQGIGYVNHAPMLDAPVAPVAGQVLITEVAVNVAQSGGWSFFELSNFGGTPVDVTGWEVWIWDGTGVAPFTAAAALLTNLGAIQPGIPHVIGESTPGIYLPNVFSINPPYNWSWTSGSGGVMVRDAQQNIVDCVYWGLATPATITVPTTIGTEWVGPPAPAIAAGVPIWRRVLSDTNSASDWISGPASSIGQANEPYWTLPKPRERATVGAVGQNWEITTSTGESLLTFLRATDEDGSRQNLTLTATVTGGTLTPAQAGFSTTFPASAALGSSPRVLTLDGMAQQVGTVIFNVTAADNSDLPLQQSWQLTVRIIPAARVTSMVVDTPYIRPNLRKDLYRGGSTPVDLLLTNPLPYPVVFQNVQMEIRAKATGALLSASVASPVGGPVTIPANTSNHPVEVTLSVPSNTSGSNGLAVLVRVTAGAVIDPASPVTNPVALLIDSGIEEFDLYHGPAPAPLVLGFTTLKPAVETVAYAMDLAITGGLGNYTWTITAGTLPNGLTLTPNGSSILDAYISGTPTLGSAAPYPLTLEVTDTVYARTLVLTLNVSTLAPLNFPNVTLPNAREFVPYSMPNPLVATGGSLVYSYGIDTFLGDDLPVGMSLNAQTGVISGTPAHLEAGTYDLYFTVDDGVNLLTQTMTTLVVEVHPLQWRTTTLPAGNETVAYNVTLDAIGGDGPHLFEITSTGTLGVLPAGLILNQQTGVINGVPAVGSSGTYTITFKVDSGLTGTASETMVLAITPPPPLTISTVALSYAEVGQTLNIQVQATGGSQNYTFSQGSGVNSVPNSVNLNANGLLSGTPVYGQDGRHTITVIVNDGYGSASKVFDLSILAPGQAMVRISEVDVAAGYIELSNTSSQHPVDVSGWKLVTWVDGNTPTALTFDTLPGASLALPSEVAMVTMGGTAGGTWPNYATGSTWSATTTSNVAVALYDSHGNLIDFVVIGSVNVGALVDGASAPANIHPDFASRPVVNNGAANYSLGASGLYSASPAGSPGVYNGAFAAQFLDLLKYDLKVAQEGQAYWDFALAVGGTPPYAFSIASPSAPWLVINATTGVITGTVPASAAGTVVVDVTVTDMTLAAVTRTVDLMVVPSAATPSATFTVGLGEGQSFEGTVIDVPVTMTLATGVTGVNGFSFVVEIPAATAAELAIWRVLPGPATVGANRSVVARDLGGNRIFVSDIDFGSSTTIGAGIVAIVQFVVPSDDTVEAPEGTYPVHIADTAATGMVGPIIAGGVNGSMELSNFAPADVNRDAIIDVVDVQLTVNIILSLFTPTYTGQGDANLDSLVDVVDVQTVVNCILFGGCQ